MADAALLPDLCDYLSLQGYVAVETSEDEADVLMPTPGDLEACDEADGEGGDFTPAPEISTLRADVAFWRNRDVGRVKDTDEAQHPGAAGLRRPRKCNTAAGTRASGAAPRCPCA
ncbi:hypothetical protein BH20ACT14_BH20ACT14_03590 [soil metagenome]